MIGAVGAVDARGAAELGGDHHHGVAPARSQPAFKFAERTVEARQQLRQATDRAAFIGMGVPAVVRERADARSVRTRQKFRCGTGGFRKERPHLCGTAGRRLAGTLVFHAAGARDGAIAAIETGMGTAWNETAVAVVTEFGRTARINGTEGTDHGTGTIALLAGGAVKGGRVISDWPGLKPGNLYEGRDLAPTTDLRAVIKGVLRDHLGLAERVLAEAVFPDSAPVKGMKGLVG